MSISCCDSNAFCFVVASLFFAFFNFFLMTSDVACIFMCLSTISLSYLKKLLFSFGAEKKTRSVLEISFVFWTGFLNEVFDLQTPSPITGSSSLICCLSSACFVPSFLPSYLLAFRLIMHFNDFI